MYLYPKIKPHDQHPIGIRIPLERSEGGKIEAESNGIRRNVSAGLSAVSAVSAENVRKASAGTRGSSAAMLTASAAARGRHLQTKAQQGRPTEK